MRLMARRTEGRSEMSFSPSLFIKSIKPAPNSVLPKYVYHMFPFLPSLPSTSGKERPKLYHSG